jgi:purine-nucleoside phosphorylase
MAYGELKGRALKWAANAAFGLCLESFPRRVVVSPVRIEQYFSNLPRLFTQERVNFSTAGNGFLAQKNGEKALFCEGGTGASRFADSSCALCHCPNVEEILFVGTGGGIGKNIQTADINVPPSCVRLDKVLEILLPPEAPEKQIRLLLRS